MNIRQIGQSVVLLALALALAAACGPGAGQPPSGAGAGGPSAGPPGSQDALKLKTADGEIRTTGALTGTWRWREGLAVCESFNSIALARDGDPNTVISLKVGPDDSAAIFGSAVPTGGVNGKGGAFDIGDGGIYTLSVLNVTMHNADVTIVVDGRIRQHC